MPHPRKRIVLNTLKKRLSLYPIVAIQGARQTGKSFLAKDLLAPKFSQSKYVSFDDEATRSSAAESSKAFLNELLVNSTYSLPKRSDFFYYRSTGKK